MLNNCPKCGKEIEKGLSKCPDCSYERAEGEVEKTEVVSTKKSKKRKLIIASVIGMFLFIIIMFGINSSIKEKRKQELIKEKAKIEKIEKVKKEKYIENVDDLISTLYVNAFIAEEYLGLVDSVWYNTIYEKNDEKTDLYTKKDGVWNEDFNDSLASLYISKFSEVSKLKKSIEEIGKDIKELNKPPKEYEDIYENLLNVYLSYESYLNFATDPSGTLMTFRQSANSKSDKFLEDYNKLKVLMPENE